MPVAKIPMLRAGLRENHRRLTRSRQAVLDILCQVDQHLTPAEVFQKAKAKYPRLGLTTVYRTLDLLAELGYIQRVHLAEGCHSYASTAQAHGHHLVCSVCGRAEEFNDCDLEPLMKALQARTGFEINVHVLELMGRCPSCRAKARTQRRKARRG